MSESNKRAGGGAKRMWPLLVGLPLIIALAAAAVLLSGERPQSVGQERQPQPGREEASQGGAKLGHPALGSADAPVVMIEYGDFQ